MPWLPDGFRPPPPPRTDDLRLEPLGVEHNVADHRAWTSSLDHIRTTPGFEGRDWPVPMSLEDNARDLRRHADDFAAGRGFTYTVLDASGDVIGCVYIYPDDEGEADAVVRSWVTADHADLDLVLRRLVAGWIRQDWPVDTMRYAGVEAS